MRRRRTIRSPKSGLVLTERDFQLLLLVGLNRYVSSKQIALALRFSADRCRRRLRQLFDHKLLDVHLLSSTAPNILSLTKQGVATVRRRYPDLGHRVRRAGTIRAIGVPHHLLVTDARIYATALGEKFGAPLTGWFGPGAAEAERLGLAAVRLRPDGLAFFDGGSVFAVEIDTGTERPPVVAKKLAKYRLARSRLTGLWLVACGGARRVETILELIREAGLARFALVMTPKHLTTRPVLRPGEAITERTGKPGLGSSVNSGVSGSSRARVGRAASTPVRRGDR